MVELIHPQNTLEAKLVDASIDQVNYHNIDQGECRFDDFQNLNNILNDFANIIINNFKLYYNINNKHELN